MLASTSPRRPRQPSTDSLLPSASASITPQPQLQDDGDETRRSSDTDATVALARDDSHHNPDDSLPATPPAVSSRAKLLTKKLMSVAKHQASQPKELAIQPVSVDLTFTGNDATSPPVFTAATEASPPTIPKRRTKHSPTKSASVSSATTVAARLIDASKRVDDDSAAGHRLRRRKLATAEAEQTTNKQQDDNPFLSQTAPETKRPPRPEKRKIIKPPQKITSQSLMIAVSAVITVFLLIVAHWAVFIHPNLEYCNATESASSNASQQQYDQWNPLGSMLPSCIPCPEHSVCSARNITQCLDDHILKPGAWSVLVGSGNPLVFPLGQPLCVPNVDKLAQEARKQQRIVALLVMLDDVVRKWVGKAECGEITPTSATHYAWSVPTRQSPLRRVLGMPLALSRQHLRALVPAKWTDEVFDEYWQIVLNQVMHPQASQYRAAGEQTSINANSVTALLSTVLDEATHQHRLLVSSKPPITNIACKVRRHLWSLLLKYALHLTITCAAIIVGLFAYIINQQRAQEQYIVSVLVQDVMDMVHCESDNNLHNPTRFSAPGLPIAHLQDHLLPKSISRTPAQVPSSPDQLDLPYVTHMDPNGHTVWSIPDAATRKRLWSLVTAEISRNSAIRKTTMEIKGQPQELWIWVASPALSPRRNKTAVLNAYSNMATAATPSAASQATAAASTPVSAPLLSDSKYDLADTATTSTTPMITKTSAEIF
eukprot:jgi/Hompol1/879/HPOL_005448-RA